MRSEGQRQPQQPETPMAQTIVTLAGKYYRITLTKERWQAFYTDFFTRFAPQNSENQISQLPEKVSVNLLPPQNTTRRGIARRQKGDDPTREYIRVFPQVLIGQKVKEITGIDELNTQVTSTLAHELMHVMRKELYPEEVAKNNKNMNTKSTLLRIPTVLSLLAAWAGDIDLLLHSSGITPITLGEVLTLGLSPLLIGAIASRLSDIIYRTNPEEIYGWGMQKEAFTSPFIIEEVSEEQK